MKSKNKRRIGAVPISLVAALALAAFLSAGLLLAPNGTPTAEAQDADCEVMVDAAGTSVIVPTAPGCEAQGDTATVVFEGADDAEMDRTLSLLIADTAGPITAYPNGTVWNTALDPDGLADGTGGNATRATSMRYRFQSVTIPKAKANPTTGDVEGQKVSVMVKGNVHVWGGSVSVTSDIDTIPDDDALDGAREVAADSDEVMITFLGNPAIGKDSANDRNKIVDDFTQCTLGTDTTDTASTDPDGNAASCTALGDDTLDAGDVAESRSKLEADGGVATYANADVSVLDGKEADITLTGTDATTGGAVVIRATIKDAKGQELEDVEVTFAATSVPALIENRTRSYDSIENGVADHTITGLPTDKPYRVSVVVTAGEDNPLAVGTIVIARAGDLHMVSAEACAMVMTGETDTKMDGCMTGYNPKMIYGPEDMFSIYATATDSGGTKVMPNPFTVKPATAATWWDPMDCMDKNDAVDPMDGEPAVGLDDMTSPYCAMYAGLSAEAMPVVMRAFGKAYGDATDAFNITADGTSVPANGMVMLTVEDDAPGAKYLLDVIATTRMGTKVIMKSDQVQVIVSGKLDKYEVDGPDYIALNGFATYTVKAMDENGNPPVFAMDKNNVKILVQPITVLVTNLDNGDLTLATNTGMGEFIVYAPLAADDGDPGRIIIGSGDMQKIKNITFGTAPPEMMAPGMPMSVMAAATSDTEIKVTWAAPESDGNSAITGYMVQSASMMADGMMSEWMDVDPAHMGMDMMYMPMGLMPETTYYYRVAAMNAEGMGDYSDGMAMATTEMTPAETELTAPTGVDASALLDTITVSWTPGSAQNASQIKVVLFNEAVTAVVMIHAINPIAGDSGAHTFETVPAGTYKVAVASYRAGEAHMLSPFTTVTVQ